MLPNLFLALVRGDDPNSSSPTAANTDRVIARCDDPLMGRLQRIANHWLRRL
jgi:hypothetical protein